MKTSQLTAMLKTTLKALEGQRITRLLKVEQLRMKPCGYHEWEIVTENPQNWELFRRGDAWGGQDVHCCFKAVLEVPADFAGESVICSVRTGAEDIWNYDNPQFLAYIDQELICGLDVNHTEFDVCRKADGGESFELSLYSYCSTKLQDVFLEVDLGVWHQDVSDLIHDLSAPLEAAELLTENDFERIRTVDSLSKAVHLLDLRKPGNAEFHASVAAARAYLQVEFYDKRCGENDVIAHCIGHTHIDIAWLWTLDQTREKVIRSFASALYLLERYPEFKFMSSQPQLYDYVKQDCPALYARVQAKIAEGRWEVEGAMWLEADCNLISGESMIRQILYGRQFFREEFGAENRVLWLPDVFGYSAALPQILKKSGIDYFMTTKIAWNDTNQIPSDTLMWQGIDGSEVLTHFITTADYDKYPELNPQRSHSTTYNGLLNAAQLKGGWQRYQNKSINKEILECYGYGDGGGGPTAQMLERGRRFEQGIPGIPKVKQTFVRAYFEQLEQRLEGNSHTPKWCGELYLEYHRGTYTSMACNKKYNRLCEFKLGDAELFSSMLLMSQSALPYPAAELEQGWKLTMLNQFHDILPGSAIKQVYEDSKVQYEAVLDLTEQLIHDSLEQVAARITADGEGIVVFNPSGFTRTDIVEITLDRPNLCLLDGDTVLPVQQTAQGTLLFVAPGVPAKGYRTLRLAERSGQSGSALPNIATAREGGFQTSYYDIRFNEKGEFISIWDKHEGREVLKSGERGNVLQVFEDRPAEYDAWNIDLSYQEKMWEISSLESMELVENGPVRACLVLKRTFMDSVIEQTIMLYQHTGRIDFATTVDWKEENLLLKTAFPVDIMSNKAAYEIQYGNVERNTHWNTSWDQARFEVCAHKWADLAEDGYGVALLNDCKYGYDIKDSVLRLSLIKSAVYPNPDADKELHQFTYALYPHGGDFRQGQVIQAAYALNMPLYAREIQAQTGSLPAKHSYVSVNRENVIIEVVKKAETSSNVVVRVYEAYGRRTKAALQLPGDTVLSVHDCDLMENIQSGLLLAADDCVEFEIKPYEIKTFLLRLG